MSNKRVIARKLKQQKKRQKQIAIIITSVVALAIIAAFTIYGINAYNNGTIMTYEGERIDVNDFKYSIVASEGAEDVKAMALSVLLEALTLKKHADDEGIVLTEEEIFKRYKLDAGSITEHIKTVVNAYK